MKDSPCWCGNTALEPFSPDYRLCTVCQTLVLADMPQKEALLVRDDESDFYGKHYFDRVAASHGLPPIATRARADLPERCVHWLRSLLRYRLPPARILELGSAHGGFVAMMRWAGFDATGLDLSPEMVAEARGRFDVPILEGPVEVQNIAPGSLDAIVLMDVLEHLSDPKETLGYCHRLLRGGGLILLQTPQYREGKSFEQMQSDNDPFLRMLKPDQHLYLFSKSSATRLLRELGATHVNFEPAIFSFYDMALAASAEPLSPIPESEVAAALERPGASRLLLALMDLDAQHRDLQERYQLGETDRADRLRSVNDLTKLLEEANEDRSARLMEVVRLESRLAEVETDRAARLEAIRTLEQQLADSEADRADRLRSAEDLAKRLRETEADRAARLEAIRALEQQLADSEADRTDRLRSAEDLAKRLQEAEADRAVRLEAIRTLEQQLADSETDRADRLRSAEDLAKQLQEAEADRAVRLEAIRTLEQQLADSEADWADRLQSAEDLAKRLQEAEADRTVRLEAIRTLEQQLADSEADRADRLQSAEDLAKRLQEAEADRTVRLEAIRTLEQQLADSEADRADRLQSAEDLAKRLQEAEADRTVRLEAIRTLELQLADSEADRADRLKSAEDLAKRLAEAEADRTVRLEAIRTLEHQLADSEADHADRLQNAEGLAKRLAEAEADRTVRLEAIRTLEQQLADSEADRADRLQNAEDLAKRLAEAEADRTVRLEAIRTLEQQLADSEADRADRLQNAEDLAKRLAEAEADRTARLEAVRILEQQLADSEADRANRLRSAEDLAKRLHEAEADRTARLEAIRALEQQLADSDADHLREIARIGNLLMSVEASRRAVLESAMETESRLLDAESGRTSALEDVGRLQSRIEAAQREEAALRESIRVLEELRRKDRELAAEREKEILDLVRNAEELLGRVRQTAAFGVMRRLGLWNWLGDAGRPAQNSEGGNKRELKHVVVDLTPVLPGGENGGAKVMTLDLISHLRKLAPGCHFTLLTSEKSHEELAWLDARNVSRLCVNTPASATRTVDKIAVRARSALARVVPPRVLDRLGVAYRASMEGRLESGGGLVRSLNADLLFCPFTALFYFDPSIPAVSVIYDLQHVYYPQFFEALEVVQRDQNFRKVCRLASRIVCISDYVRQTVLENARVPPDKVETVHILLPRRLPDVDPGAAKRTLNALQLQPGRYLLYPANFWPHKNHDVLLIAFGIYRAAKPESDLKLVLTGAPGQRRDELIQASARMGLGSCVTFPGYLDNDAFSAVLDSCLALIFPSLFEGFGMPLLEAMAARKPILCSKATSLPEVAGGAALQFDPRKPAEIARAIAEVDADAVLRDQLAHRSAERLRAFGGPEEMAASYWRIFLAAVSSPPALAEGVYGSFEDGWLGERVTLVAGPGEEERKLVLRLNLPGWVPVESITLSWPGANGAAEENRLVRGETVTLTRLLEPSQGPIELKCFPAFQPSATGLGDDSRLLTCQFDLIEIQHRDGPATSLIRNTDDV
jgi:glycosyltransferase involved in cell wall biosynthesis/2-polyprenyl-3-methyl-5-hydroxy-6-metoxy-1,4-benzoquinol methylase